MKILMAVVLVAGGLAATAAEPAGMESALKVKAIANAPSNYVGRLIGVTGRITKLDSDGFSRDSFLITVDGKLEARVNVRTMSDAGITGPVYIYRPPKGHPMLCLEPPPPPLHQTSVSGRNHSALIHVNTSATIGRRLYGVGDDVTLNGTVQQVGSKLTMNVVGFAKAAKVAKKAGG